MFWFIWVADTNPSRVGIGNPGGYLMAEIESIQAIQEKWGRSLFFEIDTILT